MEYKDIIQYVFEQEGVDPQARYLKSRKREIVQAKQITMVIGKAYLKLDEYHLAAPLGLDRCSYYNAARKVYDHMDTEPAFNRKMLRYYSFVKERIDMENQLRLSQFTERGKATTREFNGTTLTVFNDGTGYTVTSSKIIEGELQAKEIQLTYEGMKSLIDCYCELSNLIISKPL